jgi:hypothetical protein
MEYTVTVSLFWSDSSDLDLYGKVGDADVTFFNLPSSGGLSLNYDAYPNCLDTGNYPPEIISGTFVTEEDFYFWYNQYSGCEPEVGSNRTIIVTINNTGTDTISVNNTTVFPGDSFISDNIGYAGYSTGTVTTFNGTLFRILASSEQPSLSACVCCCPDEDAEELFPEELVFILPTTINGLNVSITTTPPVADKSLSLNIVTTTTTSAPIIPTTSTTSTPSLSFIPIKPEEGCNYLNF